MSLYLACIKLKSRTKAVWKCKYDDVNKISMFIWGKVSQPFRIKTGWKHPVAILWFLLNNKSWKKNIFTNYKALRLENLHFLHFFFWTHASKYLWPRVRTRTRPNGVILVGSVSGLLTGLDPNPDFQGVGYRVIRGSGSCQYSPESASLPIAYSRVQKSWSWRG